MDALAGGPVSVSRRAAHTNNFDALRLMAALMVIHGHGWVLSGSEGPGLWAVPFARVGLDVFFSISGFLVTTSWERDRRLGSFLGKRALRIFPGLAACVLVSAFVLGPAVTTLPVAAYLGDAATWRYLANVALYAELHLPGVFAGLRESGAVNGSLWSLLPEFACYLTVPLFAALPIRWRPLGLAVGALLSGCAGLWMFTVPGAPDLSIYHLELRYALVEAPFFLVGAALALVERRVGGRLWRADLCLLAFSGNYVISAWFGTWNLPFEWFTLPYLVLACGRMSLPFVRRFARFGDLSFGMYLYAFPIQQLVILLWPGVDYPVLLCVALTVPAAWLSWHLVERPAIRLRRALDLSPLPEQAAPAALG